MPRTKPPRARISQAAAVDIRLIRRWLAAEAGPTRAARTIERILRAGDLYAAHPEAGRAAPEFALKIRCYIVSPYVVFYHRVITGIEIVRVIDGRRDMPKAWQTPDDPDQAS